MDAIKIIISYVCGFILAQGLKAVISLVRGEKNILKTLTRSGGMPSGHTTSATAVAMCIGMICGFNSVSFGLAATVLFTIVYDAINVRFAVGEQGKALNKMIDEPIKVVEGHRISEVLIGVALGIVVGYLVFFIKF